MLMPLPIEALKPDGIAVLSAADILPPATAGNVFPATAFSADAAPGANIALPRSSAPGINLPRTSALPSSICDNRSRNDDICSTLVCFISDPSLNPAFARVAVSATPVTGKPFFCCHAVNAAFVLGPMIPSGLVPTSCCNLAKLGEPEFPAG